MDKIVLIDGHNAMWRANISFGKSISHVLADDKCACGAAWDHKQQTCYGELYSIVFNFFRSLRATIELFKPDKVFFVLEGYAAHRYALYPEYKANRIVKYAAKKDDMDKFHAQKEHIVRIMKHFPITTIHAANYECDDVISTLAQSLKDEDVVILSNDSDFIQLLQLGHPNIRLFNPIKKEFTSAPDYHYLAWKCLAGDKSDNITGLVGDKRAQTLVKNPEKFEDFMSTEENRANFNINKQLIEFSSVPEDQFIMDGNVVDWESIYLEFEKMEFQSIINEKSWKKYVNTFSCIKF